MWFWLVNLIDLFHKFFRYQLVCDTVAESCDWDIFDLQPLIPISASLVSNPLWSSLIAPRFAARPLMYECDKFRK